jgi:hypothetical protein
MVRVTTKLPAKKPQLTAYEALAPRGAPPRAQWVPVDADAPADCEQRKTCKYGPFRKRLKGFEPSTFCMASRTFRADLSRICLQTSGFSAPTAWKAFPAFTGRSREFRHPMGTQV